MCTAWVGRPGSERTAPAAEAGLFCVPRGACPLRVAQKAGEDPELLTGPGWPGWVMLLCLDTTCPVLATGCV